MSRWGLWGVAGGALVWAGCNETAAPEFVEAYLSSFCQAQVDCVDPAQEAFDGAPTIDDCRAVYGPEIAGWATGCKLVKDAAELCLQELDALSCPEGGAPIEEALPASCDTVWKKCDDDVDGDGAADADPSEG